MLPHVQMTGQDRYEVSSFAARLGSSRPLRMMLLIGALWMTNCFDAALTLVAHHQGVLHEMNPVGLWLLDINPQALVPYKFLMVLVGTSLLWRIHRHALAELAAWTVLGVYIIVAIRWFTYYEVYLAMNEFDLLPLDNVPL